MKTRNVYMANASYFGTTIDVEVIAVVDGDTVKIDLEGEPENLRILTLDTEESRPVPGKPYTPWGAAAKEEATSFFPEGSTITVEFPGDEPVDTCLRRYRDNYGRPLVYIHKDGEDFQERMIQRGYSPYFTKYGYAHFESYHDRYIEAERQAQADHIGVWDQIEANGQEMRNYDTLNAWWTLRAEIVESFRQAKASGVENLYDSRLDYAELSDRIGDEVIIFTELRNYRRTLGGDHAIVTIGSQSQPFKLFIPDAFETLDGERILSLLTERYIAGEYDGQTIGRPRRSYAYVSGTVTRYPEPDGDPEIVVTSIDQIADQPPSN